MKRMLLTLIVALTTGLATMTVTAQQPLTGEKYFTGMWTVSVDMAPEATVMVNFYKDDKNNFVGSISDGSGAVTMLEGVKVEGNILKASTTSPEMGTINIKITKKDENSATGDVMDGSSTITCNRYIPAK